MSKKYYITTTLPYVNDSPHVGFAQEIVEADVLARFHRLVGEEVIFNFGTDEHGQKIYQKALELKLDPQTYCDQYAQKFDALKTALNLSYTNFIRTTDSHHLKAAQTFWDRCLKNGDIYKKTYQQKYCVGCELEKTDSELVDGHCPLHPTKPLEIINEENYFFRFSKYQSELLQLYAKNPKFVIPEGKLKEITSFVNDGLQDFSISRLKSKMPWGIPVPGDDEQVMFVWFDALINYISTLGWPEDKKNFKDFWPGTQVAGKDNLRQQAAIWQAMLASADLPFSQQIFIHGFMTLNGQKISKSTGNTIDPLELVNKYGTDAVRYYLLAKTSPYEDSDFTYEKFEESYNADLANGLGNLVARVAKLCEKAGVGNLTVDGVIDPKIVDALNNFKFDEAIAAIWTKIKTLDQTISSSEPWKITDMSVLNKEMVPIAQEIIDLAKILVVFLPETAEKIIKQFTAPLVDTGEVLFPRLTLP